MSSLEPVPKTLIRDDPTQDVIWKRWFDQLRVNIGSLGGLTAGQVVFVDSAGNPTGDTGFTFNTTGDILTVGAINVAGSTAPTSGWYLPSADLIRTPNSVTIDDDLTISGGDLVGPATMNCFNVTTTTLNIGAGASAATNIGHASGVFTISRLRMGIGIPSSGIMRDRFGGSFTSNGAATEAYMLYSEGTLTGAAGDTAHLAHVGIKPTGIVTQGNSDTIGFVASLWLNEPVITKGTGDTITVASTLYVANAPTEGTTNDAIHVAAGTSRFLGNVITNTILSVSTTATVFNTVATTVNAFGAATTLALGAGSGTMTVGNATLTLTNATTVNVNGASPTLASSSTGTLTLFNTNLVTVNAFGAATTLRMGASTGLVGIGTAVDDSTKMYIAGTLTCGSGSTIGSGLRFDLNVNGSSSQVLALTLYRSGGSSVITTPGATLTIPVVSNMYLIPPTVTITAGDTVTNAVTLYISGAPTTGSNKYALFIDDGASRHDGIGSFGADVSTSTTLNLAAGTTSASSIRLAHGSAPTSPVDGDMWTTTAGLYVRINGSTVGPLT